MSSHTPGPWAFSTSNQGWTFDIYQADDARYTKESSDVATMYVRTVECDPKLVQEANARLIAAAPDLLQALQHILEDIDEDCGDAICGDCLPWREARRAIAKATGETS